MNSFNIHADTLRVVLLGLLMASGASEVVAALGQAPSTLPAASTSTAAPTAKMSAAATNAQSSLYTLHEVQLENGTRVREFATPAGLVFAVSWRGPVLPDLSSLLGSYFNTFKLETDQARMMGKRGSPVIIERADLVVRSGGRMRNFFGHAYAPDLVPAGVNVKDVLQ
jgi:hypothetical protein